MKSPLILLASLLAAGTASGHLFRPPEIHLNVLIAALAAVLAAAVHKRWKNIQVIALALLTPALGLLNMNLACRDDPSPDHVRFFRHSVSVGLEATVSEPPKIFPDRTELVVDASSLIHRGIRLPASGRVLLSAPSSGEFPGYGDVIRTKVRLGEPRTFRNPGAFDYREYLRLKGIQARAKVKYAAQIVTVRTGRKNPVRLGIENYRGKIRDMIRRNIPDPQGAVLRAMVLGEQSGISKEILDYFSRTGVSHVLAISGFNVGVVFFAAVLLFRTALKKSEYLLLRFSVTRIAVLFAAPPVILYAYIAGLGPSVVRAALAALLLVAAVSTGRERDVWNTLALSAFLIIAFHPQSILDVSFQLSFAAVWAILLIVPGLNRWFESRMRRDPLMRPGPLWRPSRAFFLFIAATVSATLGVLPLTACYFNTLSLIVVAANILIVPLLGYGVTFLSMAIIVVAPLSSVISGILMDFAALTIDCALKITACLASLPYSSLSVPTPTWTEIAAYYLLLAVLVPYLATRSGDGGEKGHFRKTSCAAAMIFLAIFFFADAVYWISKAKSDGRLEVSFLDVGQGSATFLRLPGGKTMLVDGGGTPDGAFDIGRHAVAPFLWQERIRKIDVLVLTHPHPDHLNGLLFILDRFHVGEVWSNGRKCPSEPFRQFIEKIRNKEIVHRVLHSGIPDIDLDGTRIKIFNPGPRAARGGYDREENDRSLVLKISYGETSILLPADISARAEYALMKKRYDLKSDILLVPHHGSRTSSSPGFIRKVSPRAVVFSCGSDPYSRLPHPLVLRRYEKFGAGIFRTDRDGAVTFRTDGKDLSWKRFVRQQAV